jgi:hypothetical protein
MNRLLAMATGIIVLIIGIIACCGVSRYNAKHLNSKEKP